MCQLLQSIKPKCPERLALKRVKNAPLVPFDAEESQIGFEECCEPGAGKADFLKKDHSGDCRW